MQTQTQTQDTLKNGRPSKGQSKGEDSPRFALSLPRELRDLIRNEAKRLGIKEAEVVRRYLIRGIEKTVSG